MKTQFYGASSLDGFLAGPDDELDWLLQFQPEGSTYPDFIQGVGALCMGSATYEWLLRHLDASGEGWPYEQPAWVFTTRDLRAPPGADVRFVRGDVRPVHEEMVRATGDRNVWVVGGGDLAGQFHDAGLLDELIIQVTPVTLGAGKPLFPRRVTHPPLRLLGTTTFDGFVEVRYEVPQARRRFASAADGDLQSPHPSGRGARSARPRGP